ncbi:UNVERIFIED_CONTAM: hypothetical protein K2H54_020580 [Gekko kuhli]
MQVVAGTGVLLVFSPLAKRVSGPLGWQAKPIYGGWLLLAPEGTDFDNPVHRSRKWQRRFFILYEHGLLRYALDEMVSLSPPFSSLISKTSFVSSPALTFMGDGCHGGVGVPNTGRAVSGFCLCEVATVGVRGIAACRV